MKDEKAVEAAKTEMLPCPFCGSDQFKPKVCKDILDYCILCTQCGVESGDADSEEEAVQFWNTRAAPTFTVGQLCELLAKGNEQETL